MIKIWWIIILGRLFIIDFFIGELNDLETVAFHRMIVDLEFCFNYILLFFFFFLIQPIRWTLIFKLFNIIYKKKSSMIFYFNNH